MHFLYEDAKFCRYDARCECELCMFKHRKEENNLHENIESLEDVNDKIENIIDVVENDEEIENDDVNENENDSVNMTFSNPSQPKINTFKCDKCY